MAPSNQPDPYKCNHLVSLALECIVHLSGAETWVRHQKGIPFMSIKSCWKGQEARLLLSFPGTADIIALKPQSLNSACEVERQPGCWDSRLKFTVTSTTWSHKETEYFHLTCTTLDVSWWKTWWRWCLQSAFLDSDLSGVHIGRAGRSSGRQPATWVQEEAAVEDAFSTCTDGFWVCWRAFFLVLFFNYLTTYPRLSNVFIFDTHWWICFLNVAALFKVVFFLCVFNKTDIDYVIKYTGRFNTQNQMREKMKHLNVKLLFS